MSNILALCFPSRRRLMPVEVEAFPDVIANDIFQLSSEKTGATVVFNYEDPPDNDIWLMKLADGGVPLKVAYNSKQFKRIFRNKSDPAHDGAVIITFFGNGQPTVYSAKIKLPVDIYPYGDDVITPVEVKKRGLRHQSGYSACHYTKAIIAVVSEEKGQVSLFKHSQYHLDVTMGMLAQELRDAYTKQLSRDSYEAAPFDERHFTAHFSSRNLNIENEIDLKWYYRNFVKTQLELFTGSTLLGQKVARDTKIYKQIRSVIAPNDAAGDMESFRRKNWTNFCILLYGTKRVGGFFYRFDLDRKEIVIERICIERELVIYGQLAQFFEQLCKATYPGIHRIWFFCPTYLIEPMHPLFDKFDFNEYVVSCPDNLGIQRSGYMLNVSKDIPTSLSENPDPPCPCLVPHSAVIRSSSLGGMSDYAEKKKTTNYLIVDSTESEVHKKFTKTEPEVLNTQLRPDLFEDGRDPFLIFLHRISNSGSPMESWGASFLMLKYGLILLEVNEEVNPQLRAGDRIVAINGEEITDFLPRSTFNASNVVALQIDRLKDPYY
ncbi:disA bacterial checkpoint controller nucleotide-binding domain-containing protein [Ditylenchus destructor]|uniref:DisA bacterial checkpoint controller nucleotide-binding domain-containing protein n=1 Tax=Ditylenchus destructor TaxID=166010 RepID=A0AAD4ML38_9BILA|nr:disA bacterial checkpoint controller nucleotide-binding domain-containing protein [Ditylenchus destructor]